MFGLLSFQEEASIEIASIEIASIEIARRRYRSGVDVEIVGPYQEHC